MPDPASFDDIKNAWESKEAAQWWLLFAVMVANKPAEVTRKKLDDVLARCGIGGHGGSPFYRVQVAADFNRLKGYLHDARTGQYTRIERAFRAIIEHSWRCSDPRYWTLTELLAVPGVGPKTARWFRLLVNPRERVAALDTHVLKFLADNYVVSGRKHDPETGFIPPKLGTTTPAEGPTYRYWEQKFIEAADKLGLSPRDLDYFVWAVYRKGGHVTI